MKSSWCQNCGRDLDSSKCSYCGFEIQSTSHQLVNWITKHKTLLIVMGCLGVLVLIQVSRQLTAKSNENDEITSAMPVTSVAVSTPTTKLIPTLIPASTPVPKPTLTPVPKPTLTPVLIPAQADTNSEDIDLPVPLIGCNKDYVMKAFEAAGFEYDPRFNLANPPDIKYVARGMLYVVMYIDQHDRVEGVSFLSHQLGEPITGYGSYVHKNHGMLLWWATGNKPYPYRHNSSTAYPVDLHVGNIHQ